MTASNGPSFGALELLFHSSADCIKLLDLDGHLSVMNLGGARSMELDHPGQLVGRNWVAFWGGDDRAAALEAIETARSGGVGRSFGYLPTAKGAPRWWDSIVTAVPGRDGGIEQLLVVSRDVSERHRLEQESKSLREDLQAALHRTQALIRATSEIVWQSDPQQRKVIEHGWTSFTGRELSDRGRNIWLATIHPDDRDRVNESSRIAWVAGKEHRCEYRLRHHTGEYRWVEDRVVPMHNGEGTLIEWVGVITDVHVRVTAAQAIRDAEERLRLAVAAGRVGIWDVDLLTGDRRWSAELKAILGLPEDAGESEALLFQLIVPVDRSIVEEAHRDTFLQASGFPAISFRIRRADTGEERWIFSRGRAVLDPTGRPVRRIGTFQDVTEQKRTEERLWRAANEDALTKLPNRNRFGVELETALATAEKHRSRVALFIVDLDNFKEINDTLGHDAGDRVLRSMADRLTSLTHQGVTVARLGGDEFAILVANAGSVAEIRAEAANVIRALSKPIPLESGALRCFASIGVAIYPDHDRDGRELFKNADLALYNAKGAGRAQAAFFDLSMRGTFLRRVGVLQRARDALSRRDVVPFYQPKISMTGDDVCGFEALLRLREGSAIVSPAAIAEAFEDPELSVQIGDRMLDAVIGDMRTWREIGLPFGSVAVNVSTAEFSRLDMAEVWLARLRDAGLPTSMLHMEVTETVLLDGGSDAVGVALAALSQAGIEIALDDFGTGFASLTHLRKFPVSWLKIDQSFVRDLGVDAHAHAIVSAVTTLAHGIGLRVVAEGVETPLQASMLSAMGCDTVQGYLAAEPMPASRVPSFLRRWRGLNFSETRQLLQV